MLCEQFATTHKCMNLHVVRICVSISPLVLCCANSIRDMRRFHATGRRLHPNKMDYHLAGVGLLPKPNQCRGDVDVRLRRKMCWNEELFVCVCTLWIKTRFIVEKKFMIFTKSHLHCSRRGFAQFASVPTVLRKSARVSLLNRYALRYAALFLIFSCSFLMFGRNAIERSIKYRIAISGDIYFNFNCLKVLV